jgi:hypothetical protein
MSNISRPFTIAENVVVFLSSLHGFEEFGEDREAAIDLETGMVVRANADYPDGQILWLHHAPGFPLERVEVRAHKLLAPYFLRHARMEADINGGKVQGYYEALDEHFSHKTGYGNSSD